jgi:cell division protein FtsL
MPKKNKTREQVEMEKKRRTRFFMMLSLLFILYFLLSFIFGDMGLISHYRMKKTYQKFEQELDQLSKENERLRKEAEALKTDPHYIERLARERLGLSKEGEIIYQYEENNKEP